MFSHFLDDYSFFGLERVGENPRVVPKECVTVEYAIFLHGSHTMEYINGELGIWE